MGLNNMLTHSFHWYIEISRLNLKGKRQLATKTNKDKTKNNAIWITGLKKTLRIKMF